MDTAITQPAPHAAQANAAAPAADPVAELDRRFDELYHQVFRFLHHRLANAELADELTADTFYRAADAIRRGRRGHAALHCWLLRIAANLANTHHRRIKQWFRALTGRIESNATTSPAEPSANDDRDRVRRAIRNLAPAQQTAVLLRYYVRMNYDEIATVLGCSPVAARADLSRAIRRLRTVLEPHHRESQRDAHATGVEP
jgi:RNA polymerase sigma-70 factor (ECF subfamily)